MNRHPGGEEHTRHMLELSGLRPPARVLDLGAGAGESVKLLRSLGFQAEGIDLQPRSDAVKEGDLLKTGLPGERYDAVLSQCAFTLSGDVSGALSEAWRVLKPGGLLLWSDLLFQQPEGLLEAAGLTPVAAEDMTAQWREYYLEALWREDTPACDFPGKKARYWLLIGRKERIHGSD